MTYEEFKLNQSALPERQAGPRSDIVTSLDTLWNMRFRNLSRNSLALLSVLSLMSPGKCVLFKLWIWLLIGGIRWHSN